MQGPLNVPPLFQINREEIIKPVVATAQVVVDQAAPTKQPIDQKEMELNPPNKTLYVNRLNEKVMVEEMRQTLYTLFSQCGKVLDIIVKKNILMRGQAFILMDDEEQAIKAQQTFHNTQLYDKVMKVNFAKEKSYFFAKQEGVYEEKEKLPMSDKIKEHKKKIQDRRYREMINQKQQREAPTISMPLTPNQMIGSYKQPKVFFKFIIFRIQINQTKYCLLKDFIQQILLIQNNILEISLVLENSEVQNQKVLLLLNLKMNYKRHIVLMN